MTPENFCYWLQGSLELTEGQELTAKQVTVIKDHLNLVFDKKTPPPAPSGPPLRYVNDDKKPKVRLPINDKHQQKNK